MHVPIQHIIGTVALIGLVISAGLFYSVMTSFVGGDINQKQLAQISENVSLSLVEMMNLVKFAKYSSSGYMTKALDLPSDLSGKAYGVRLVNGTNQWGYVHTFLTTQNSTNADSQIPFNTGETEIQLYTSDTVLVIQVGLDNTTIACSGTIYGGNSAVVWASPVWNTIDGVDVYSVTIGIGWVKAT